jgi:hypothetical protein
METKILRSPLGAVAFLCFAIRAKLLDIKDDRVARMRIRGQNRAPERTIGGLVRTGIDHDSIR